MPLITPDYMILLLPQSPFFTVLECQVAGYRGVIPLTGKDILPVRIREGHPLDEFGRQVVLLLDLPRLVNGEHRVEVAGRQDIHRDRVSAGENKALRHRRETRLGM